MTESEFYDIQSRVQATQEGDAWLLLREVRRLRYGLDDIAGKANLSDGIWGARERLDHAQERLDEIHKICMDSLRFRGGAERDDLVAVIKSVHAAVGDDVCWMDIDKIFAAAGLPVPDRKVGNKYEMLQNCAKFLNVMCDGGEWESYESVLKERDRLRKAVKLLMDALPEGDLCFDRDDYKDAPARVAYEAGRLALGDKLPQDAELASLYSRGRPEEV